MRKFFHKQTNWITLLCSTPTQLLLHFSVLTLTQPVNQVLWVNFQVKATVYFEIVQCGVRIRQWEKRFRLKFYLSAVQIQILVSHLQLQHLHLVVPLFYYRGVPHWASIQSWFSPTHYLREEDNQNYYLLLFCLSKSAKLQFTYLFSFTTSVSN